MSNYKREMPQEVKNKISAKLKGRKLTQSVKNKIGASVKKRWQEAGQTPITSTPNNMEKNMSGNVQSKG